MKKLLLAFLFALPAMAQTGPPTFQYVSQAPSGSCGGGITPPIQIVYPTGAAWACASGTWSSFGGSTGAGATFPGSPGVVFNTSTISSRNATGADVAPLLASQSVTVAGLKDTALTTGTSPICPNGTGGAFTTSGCATGGSIAVTPSILKGNNAGGAVAATSGTDYIAPAPTGTQTVSQPTGTSLNVSKLNNQYNADAAPNTCTTNEGFFNHQADCAFYQAYDYSVSYGNPITLAFHDNYYLKCAQWTQPGNGFYGVNIIGASMNSSYIIQDTGCPLTTTAMMNQPNHGAANYQMENVTWNATSTANSCFDLTHMDDFVLVNVNCEGVIPGSDHDIQIGSSSSFADDGIMINVGTSPPYGLGSTTFAAITGTLTGTSLTALSCGGSCGTYPSAGFVKGFVNDPHHYCSTLPAFTPVMSGNSIGSFTITNAGNCTSLPDFYAMMNSGTATGMRLYISDATTIDLNPNDGLVGATVYSNTTLIHWHPTEVPTAIAFIDILGVQPPNQNGGSMGIYNIECDTIGTLCMDFQTTAPLTVAGHQQIWGSLNQPGSALFNLEYSNSQIQFSQLGNICGFQGCPADVQEFILPTGVVTPGGSGWPINVSVLQNDPTNGTGNFVNSMVFNSLGANGNFEHIFGNVTFTQQMNHAVMYGNDDSFLTPSCTATSSLNCPSYVDGLQTGFYNGSTTVTERDGAYTSVGTGANPTVTLDLGPLSGVGNVNSTGQHYVAMPGINAFLSPPVLPATLYSAAGTALPTCNSSSNGTQATVSDATSPTYMGTYTSGGAITTAVICSFNGTAYAWKTH